MRNDADDVPELDRAVAARVHLEPLPDRVLTRKITLGQQLIDDDRRRLIFGVACLESPSPQRWCSHRFEIAGRHHIHLDRREFAGLRLGCAFGHERGLPASHQRRIGSDGRVLHAGKSGKFFQQRPVEIRELGCIRISRLRQIHSRRKQ